MSKTVEVDYGAEYSKQDPSTLRLYMRDFKEVKEMTIGQEVKLEVTAKVVSVSSDEYGMGSDSKHVMARLDLTKVEKCEDSDD